MSPTHRQRPFRQVDVFTATPYYGNPLAVVLDGAGLSDDEMQRFARWTNLSETTFVLPPTQAGADYRVRIFTPGAELPFAGHPTLGSCHAWLEAGGTPRASGAAGNQPKQADVIVQECAVGLVTIRRAGHLLAFAAPPLQRSTPAPELLTAALHEQPVSEVFTSNLLKSNCLVTGQPDWASVQIAYSGPQIDQGGLLQYLVSFRNHNEFHEQCVERIYMDVWTRCKPTKLTVYARYTRRGGLDINPWRTSHPQALPANVRTARQ